MISNYTRLQITFEETGDNSDGIDKYMEEMLSTVEGDYYFPGDWYPRNVDRYWHMGDTLTDDYVLVLMVPDDKLKSLEKWLHQNPNFTNDYGEVKVVNYERVLDKPTEKYELLILDEWIDGTSALYEAARDADRNGLKAVIPIQEDHCGESGVLVTGTKEQILCWLENSTHLELCRPLAPSSIDDWEKLLKPILSPKLTRDQQYSNAAAQAIIDGDNPYPANWFQLCISIPEIATDELLEEPFVGTADQILERIGSHFFGSEMSIDCEGHPHVFVVQMIDPVQSGDKLV